MRPRSAAGEASRSASICSSCSSVSFWPSRSKILTPLYSGGLCEAEMTTPASRASSATAGVGSTPPSTAFPPAATTPRTNASSSSGPEPRVSRPMKTRPRPHQRVTALPSCSTSSGVSVSPTTPRTPSVPKYVLAIRTEEPSSVIEREDEARRRDRVLLRDRDDRRADGEELDHVRGPAVTALLEVDANDALGLERLGLGLHALHRQLTRVVERLGVVRHLDVAADPPEPAAEALVGDVVHAVAHH